MPLERSCSPVNKDVVFESRKRNDFRASVRSSANCLLMTDQLAAASAADGAPSACGYDSWQLKSGMCFRRRTKLSIWKRTSSIASLQPKNDCFWSSRAQTRINLTCGRLFQLSDVRFYACATIWSTMKRPFQRCVYRYGRTTSCRVIVTWRQGWDFSKLYTFFCGWQRVRTKFLMKMFCYAVQHWRIRNITKMKHNLTYGYYYLQESYILRIFAIRKKKSQN